MQINTIKIEVEGKRVYLIGNTYAVRAEIKAAGGGEIAERGITPEAAEKWLADYSGCVGHEIYEFALAQKQTAV